MSTDKELKISFCTTCKGRLSHLQETLPQNLENNKHYSNSEFVILDYGSEDGLGDWIKERYQPEIDSGKIRYARVDPKDAPYFKMAHAKNMAHRMATGDVLCNLDADNITGPDFANWLNKKFTENPNIFVRMDRLTQDKKRVAVKLKDASGQAQIKIKSIFGAQCETPPPELIDPVLNGAWGRIAITHDNFMRLGGYDETLYKGGWGHEDNDFAIRARMAGIEPVALPYGKLGKVFQHSNNARTELMAPEDKTASEHLLEGFEEKRKMPLLKRVRRHIDLIRHPEGDLSPSSAVANPDGNFGCGAVTVNFKDNQALGPVEMSMVEKLKRSQKASTGQVSVAHGHD